MFDFLNIVTKIGKNGTVEVYPEFKIVKSKDLMIRGKDFYAVWLEDQSRWSTDEQDVLDAIDHELDIFAENYKQEMKEKFGESPKVRVSHIKTASTRMINTWHTYCTKDMRDNWKPLDERITFLNDKIKKTDYISKRTSYALEPCPTPAYDRLMSVLYSDAEREKLEWAIGSIVNGDSKRIQKFVVLYGASGTGKSTVLNIIMALFDGYYGMFDAKALGNATSTFALEAFKANPLVAIQHDGDLSRIDDNTRLNSLTSHEIMTINEKFKGLYSMRINSFLFMGTNKPVKITDAKSGLIRRLIDVSPTGKKIPKSEYDKLMHDIEYELGGIAYHCKEVYESNRKMYDNYIPEAMIDASNDFYDFIQDNFLKFSRDDPMSLNSAFELYKLYCNDAKVPYPFSRRIFKEELKNYYENFELFGVDEKGEWTQSVYSGFKDDLFRKMRRKKTEEEKIPGEKTENTNWLELTNQPSILDIELKDCPAQYAVIKKDGTDKPKTSWDLCTTTTKDLDTSKLHYILAPEIQGQAHVFIDFDLKDENGNKSFEKNVEAASKWKKTYAETSKSDAGIHLHYIYTGDTSKLDTNFDEGIEVKVFTGKAALRRKLTRCNNVPVATISSGLPLKKETKVVNDKQIKNEQHLRRLIVKSIHKEIHPGTKPSVDFIVKILNDAYESGISYDISDMYELVWDFAAGSTNHADYCLGLLGDIHWKSADKEETPPEMISDWKPPDKYDDNVPITIYDIEVFPNLFLICWKYYGVDMPVVRMFNPTPDECLEFSKKKLVGFNCRKYDNHIVYGRIQHLSNEGLYQLSRKIIVDGDKNAMYGAAYDMSYTDIYDYCANKQSLKKWEIELNSKRESDYNKANKLAKEGLSTAEIATALKLSTDTVELYLTEPFKPVAHKELGLPWDKPVPEDRWDEVAAYCDNDVLATEAVFEATQADFLARKILADIAGLNYNATTNTLTTRIIFGNDRSPQGQFNYRNMAEGADHCAFDDEYTCFDKDGKPVFPGYEYKKVMQYLKNGKEKGYKYKSLYRDEEVGEGGYVYAEPGIYHNVALLDIASMHPSSIIAEWLFGRYTQKFQDLVQIRLLVKHKQFDEAKKLFDGKLAAYLDDPDQAKQLAQALKIAINSVYGLTSAGFTNPFRDPRNKDNIVAKRGALFMINLKHQVQERGFTVAHIKTDSIKIPDATPEIIQFVMDYGKMYGYTFEHEATYEKMCLVNNAVYIAKYADGEHSFELPTGEKVMTPWTATGTQFQVSYVFKSLFAKLPIEFRDMCETKSVTGESNLYLDMNENLPDVSELEKLDDKKLKEFNAKIEAHAPESEIDILGHELDQLAIDIGKGHSYQFVGRVGSFCPIKPGCGGGLLYRYTDGKYYSAAGTSQEWTEERNDKKVKCKKTYRWLESETAKTLGTPIDREYYEFLVDEARKAIGEYGDVEEFIN